jgi:hypothetical protein
VLYFISAGQARGSIISQCCPAHRNPRSELPAIVERLGRAINAVLFEFQVRDAQIDPGFVVHGSDVRRIGDHTCRTPSNRRMSSVDSA